MSLQQLRLEELRFLEAETPELYIESWSNATRVLRIRGFTKDGLISIDHTTNADRSRAIKGERIPDFPISIQVSPATAPVRRGECYVRLTLRLGGFPVGRLMAAYLTDGKTLTWPPGVFEGFTEGPGLIRTVTGTGPMSGSEILESVPTNARWRLRAVILKLATNATVGDRGMQLYIDDGSDYFNILPDPVAQPASTTNTYSFQLRGDRYTGIVDATYLALVLPDVIMAQGYRFMSWTLNMQGGDYYEAPVFQVEEWIEE